MRIRASAPPPRRPDAPRPAAGPGAQPTGNAGVILTWGAPLPDTERPTKDGAQHPAERSFSAVDCASVLISEMGVAQFFSMSQIRGLQTMARGPNPPRPVFVNKVLSAHSRALPLTGVGVLTALLAREAYDTDPVAPSGTVCGPLPRMCPSWAGSPSAAHLKAADDGAFCLVFPSACWC